MLKEITWCNAAENSGRFYKPGPELRIWFHRNKEPLIGFEEKRPHDSRDV